MFKVVLSVAVAAVVLSGCTTQQPRYSFRHIYKNNFALLDNQTGSLWVSMPCSFNQTEGERLDPKVEKALFLDSVESLSGSRINYCMQRVTLSGE